MRSILSVALALGSVPLIAAELPVRTVYQFASNTTWLENLFSRSNGLVLATEIGPPASLLQFDPRQAHPEPSLNLTFDTVLGISGIAEGAHDVFYITGANTTGSNIEDPPTNATHVWQIDFNQPESDGSPKITLIARPQAPTGFNGMTAFNSTVILASATYQDSVFAIDTTTGYVWEAFKDSSMDQINGIKYQEPYLYWAANGDLERAIIYPNFTLGTAESIIKVTAIDDFDIAPVGFRGSGLKGNNKKWAYSTTATGNTIIQVSWYEVNGTISGANYSTIAGAEDSTEVAEPTGTFFGRGAGLLNKLFITTGGGSGLPVDVNGTDVAVGAQLLEISLGH